MRLVPSVMMIVVVAVPATVRAEEDYFLSRSETVPARTYLESDGAVVSDKPAESPWDTFVGEAVPEPNRLELPGLWPIRETSSELQTLVIGPTFRNQEDRIEVGAGVGYINARWRLPFELSVEPTWRRNKNTPSGERDFSRVRTFGLVELWSHGTDWGSTSIAATGFYDTQSDSFHTLELGGAVSQTIGRRLSLSGNVAWSGTWPHVGSFENAPFGSFGGSYNVGAGLRVGGFYEPHNKVIHDDDWGGFVSYQLLPFAELTVNAGKHEFVMVRLMISYALERERQPHT